MYFSVFLYLQRLEAKQCVLENNQIDFLFVTWARDSEELLGLHASILFSYEELRYC